MEFSTQVKTFLLILATGMLLGMMFDLYRVLRGVFRPPWFITPVTDFVYCLAAAAVAFLALVMGNWGELRFYVFVAMFVGMAGYYRLASRQFIRIFISLFRLVANVWRWLKLVLMFTIIKPTGFIVRGILLPFRYLRRKTADWYRSFRPPPPPTDETPPL